MEKEDSVHRSDLSKIAKNAGISGIGEVASNVLGYLTSIIMARAVGPFGLGVFNLANIVMWVAQVLSSAGLNEGLLRFVAHYKARKDMPRVNGAIIFGTKITLLQSILAASVLFYAADYLSVKIFHNIDVGWALKILIFSLPLLALGELWLRAIQSFQEVKYQIYIQKICQPVIKLLVLVVLFWSGMKLGGILAASIVSIAAGFALSLFYLNKIHPVYEKASPPVYEKKELILFSLPLSLTQFLGVLNFYVDSLMLGYFKTAAEVGIYSIVTRLALLIVLPLTAINNIFAPMISEYHSKQEIGKMEEMFKTVTKWVFVLSLPVFLIFVLFDEPILTIFGKSFAAGALALIILGGGELINAGSGPVGYILMMTGRSKMIFINSVVFLLLNMTLNYMLIPRYGIAGAAAATGLSVSVINIIRLIQVYFILKMHPFKLSYFKPCLAGVLAFVMVLLIVKNIEAISMVTAATLSILFVGLYGIIIYLLKLDVEDEYILQLVFRKLTNFRKA